MLKNFCLILFICLALSARPQGVVIGAGGNMVLQNASNVVLSSNSYWTNNGNAGCQSGSWVRFTGNAAQIIQGANTTAFSNVDVNNSAQGVQVGRDISILSSLLMTQGDFDLKNALVDLSTTGVLNNETSARRVKATNGGGADGGGTGTMRAIRDNPVGNISNLGLTVNLTGVGVYIIRGHLVQQGTGSFAANTSVFRYYQIENAPFAGTSATFNTCYPQELNGHNPATLIMFQWKGDAGGGPYFWSPVNDFTGAALPITKNLLTSSLAWVKVTLGSEAMPLPIELISFTGSCYNNSITLNWKTASEYNNSHFVTEKSYDGINFSQGGIVPGAGNSSQVNTYSYGNIAVSRFPVYFRLIQVDYNGEYSVSELVTVNDCNNQPGNQISIHIGNNQDIIISSVSGVEKKYTVDFMDITGKKVHSEKIFVSENDNIQILSTRNLATGIYVISLWNEEEIITQKILIEH